MIFQKKKAIIAAALSAAVLTSTMLPLTASAAGIRTKSEAFGDETYAQRFMSLYDDVITNGQDNGYLSKTNAASGGFGIPYHAVETCIVEAPDYGHETTSEAMSYIVWMAAMRDNVGKNSKDAKATATSDLAKAWKTMEAMVPTVQTGFWEKDLSSQVADEHPDDVEKYPSAGSTSNTGKNPIHSYFKSAYSGDKGEYLLHWLADVDDWYGYGGAYESGTGTPSKDGKFTFINTFQRGDQESCFETIPHPCVEDLKYGNATQGMKGAFSTDSQVAAQWSYTNAPDAEDRAIQAVYAANLWGVGSSDLSAKAGKMGDQLRNDMFDKYYKAIGCQSKESPSTGYESCHYLMSWYTSWGGAKDGMWAWQIGCSHSHQFYQNPLAAYGLLYDKDLNAGMKAEGATKDYTTSIQRQIEMYLWLQSADGPFAGGCTNSFEGQYKSYPSSISTFYDMAYVEHPVYADPGSNHWIGNQVWSTQRLAELYYYIKTNGDASNGAVKPGGMTIEEALKTLLDKWVGWFLNEVELTDDGDYAIPGNLDWTGQPATWTGTYSASANSGLTCKSRDMGNGDCGCVASLSNALIHYAKAEGATAADATANASTTAGKALYTAQQLMDRMWKLGRDDIGVTRESSNGSLTRMFDQVVYVPSTFTGTMPYGQEVKTGVKFIDLRPMYNDDKEDEIFQAIKKEYETSKTTDKTYVRYHRFWHVGDVMMTLGTLSTLYPELTPDPGDDVPKVTTTTTDGGATGKNLYGDVNCDEVVAIADVVLLARYVSQDAELPAGSVSAQGKLNADVNIDDQISSDDISNISRYLAGFVTLPVKD